MALLTTPFKANGTTLAYKLLPATTFTPVGQLKSFDPGGTDVAAIDTTLLASVAYLKIASIPDNGDVSLTVFLVPGDPTVAAMQAWSQAPPTLPWQIQLPDGTNTGGTNTGTTITFNAFLSKYTPKGFETGNSPTADITLTISGGVTMTPGS